MSDAKGTEPSPMNTNEMMSALFAHLIMQQANMAMMLMGKTPNPETGQTMRDLEAAKLFVDMLEMLEAKTKGNLSPDEQKMLKQTLMAVRMAFVEAAGTPAPAAVAEKPATQPATAPTESLLEKPSAPAEESHKKFSKKY